MSGFQELNSKTMEYICFEGVFLHLYLHHACLCFSTFIHLSNPDVHPHLLCIPPKRAFKKTQYMLYILKE